MLWFLSQDVRKRLISVVPLNEVLLAAEIDAEKLKGLSRSALEKVSDGSTYFELSADGTGIRLKSQAPSFQDCTVYLVVYFSLKKWFFCYNCCSVPRRQEKNCRTICRRLQIAQSCDVWRLRLGVWLMWGLPMGRIKPNGRKNNGFAFVRFAHTRTVQRFCKVCLLKMMLVLLLF